MSGTAIYNDVRNFSINALKVTRETVENISYYYPKTLVIAAIVSVIFTILFPTITGVLGLALSLYIIYPLKNTIATAITVHDENNISEFSSSNIAKDNLILEIQTRALAANLVEGVRTFFGF
jgi:hypothetical protein